MDLQTQKNNLKNKLQVANNLIVPLTIQNNVAFDDCKIKIYYYYYDRHIKQSSSKSIDLTENFSVIAMQMMDVTIAESLILAAVKNQIFKDDIQFTDDRIIKKLMNEFRALDLVHSFWSEDKSNLYWGLTTKGQRVRDDMTLIRNKG